jgi:rhodanese-related sulfurtransferase
MSSTPDSWYEDEYWEEIGRKEDIDNAIKNLSHQPIRDFLGTFGDAIDRRVGDVIAQARYARQGGYPQFAILGAVTAIELIARYMLVQPLLQGAFLSGSWAKILTQHIIQRKQAAERELLPSILSMYDIKLDEMKLSDGSLLWKTFVTVIVPKRNSIAHDGETATPDEANLALECAHALRRDVVAQVAKKMDFDLEKMARGTTTWMPRRSVTSRRHCSNNAPRTDSLRSTRRPFLNERAF